MPVVRVIAEVVNTNLDQARFGRTANYSKVKDRGEDLRKYRYDIEPHFNFGFTNPATHRADRW